MEQFQALLCYKETVGAAGRLKLLVIENSELSPNREAVGLGKI